MASTADKLLSERTPGQVVRAAVRIGGATIEQIEASLPGALAGEREQVRLYVGAYREFTDRVLDAVGEARPDLLMVDEDRHVLLAIEVKGHRRRPKRVQWLRAALEQEAMSVPFSGWVGTLGAGRGSAVAVVALLRATLPGAQPLARPRAQRLPEWKLDDRGVVRFYRAVVDELSRVETPLDQIASVFGLTQTDLATLFGVRRQALEQWETRGVPASRQEKLATVGEIADLLAAKLKRDRIPGVVRRAAAAYGDRSVLEAIQAGDQDRVLAELRGGFDWAVAA